jgi:hypothetical protein
MALREIPAALPRLNEVTKRYQDVSVLAGFMDDNHFYSYATELIETLDHAQVEALFARVERARQAAAKLGTIDFQQVELRPINHSRVAALEADERFQADYYGCSYRFCWVNARNLVALQTFLRSGHDPAPSSGDALIDYALPHTWDVPAEICFTPPYGPIYILSSSPHVDGVNISVDKSKGQIILGAPPHLNLIHVAHFGGRYYLRNGYHRVCEILAAGCDEIPAIVMDYYDPSQVELANLGAGAFAVSHLMNLERPPLVADFGTGASIDIEMREKRYAASITLQMSTITIPI